MYAMLCILFVSLCIFPQMVDGKLRLLINKRRATQEEYWEMANELALEFGACPENVHPDDFEPGLVFNERRQGYPLHLPS